jgi:T5orf172 domain
MNAGHVYVLAFGNGIVKVGRTQNLKRRMWNHKSAARKSGTVVADSWVSPLHVEWEIHEDTLKEIAAKYGGRPLSPEYFEGADYASIVSAATRLPFTPPSDETADGAGPECPRRPPSVSLSVRQCVIRTGALDAKVRETADAARGEWWERFKAVTSCGRCEAVT